MTLQMDRRLLLQTGSFGIAALALPGVSLAMQAARGFTHSVASGEPSQDSVLLWARYVGDGDMRLTVELLDPNSGKAVASGETVARPERDFIAKTVIDGLEPGRWYFYRFVAPDGTASPTGRTRTLPDDATDRFNLGIFSCSNLPFGYFNAYAHAAARSDLDLLVHLGDYLYEYAPGTYPDTPLPSRTIAPDKEILSLTDYRLRYQSYRADPDLQRLHQLFPMLSQWDDHELTNNAWKNGAQNHQSDEGDWGVRKRIARRVYREWMPVSDLPDDRDEWKSYQIGDLATILLTESRLHGRDEQLSLSQALIDGQDDIPAALAAFRDGPWLDPQRSMLGRDQEEWLAKNLATSTRSGTKWQVWAQQCVMGELRLPEQATEWVSEAAPANVRRRALIGSLAAQAGLPLNYDSWDGYPAARERSLRAAQAVDADLIVLSGDSHNGWAYDLAADGQPAGVDWGAHSVTSPGFENSVPELDPATLAAALRQANPSLRWADTSQRGYMTVALTPERATATWHFVDTIQRRSTKLAGEQRMTVLHGTRKLIES